MSTSWPGNMRGTRVKTPLLLLLLLLTSLTGTVLCQYDDEGEEPVATTEFEEPGLFTSDIFSTTIPSFTENSLEPDNVEEGSGGNATLSTPETDEENILVTTPTTTELEGLSPTIILIPVVLVVVIIAIIVCCIFTKRRWNNKAGNQDLRKENPYMDEPSTDKVPMPMFEEDVPSVLELEMDELDQWMKKDDEIPEDSKLA